MDKINKKVSVIMTSYNYARFIGKSIESVINQTYPDWELIIADDGSTDNSVEVIENYLKKDSRIKFYRHEGGVNKGLAETLKFAVSKAQYEWIAFLESDDLFTENSLSEKFKTIEEHPDIELLFTDVELIGDKDRIKEYRKYFKQEFERDKSKYIEDFQYLIPRGNIIPTFSSVMLKKSILDNCNFNSPCKASVDYFLWAQLSARRTYYLHKKLTKWRIHHESYINIDKHSWFTRFIFFTEVYYFTIRDKNPFIKTLLMLNYIRTRIIYLKFCDNSIKLNLLNHKFIFEKKI